jgi:cytochrome P450
MVGFEFAFYYSVKLTCTYTHTHTHTHSFDPGRFSEVSKVTKFRPFGVPSKRKCPADQFTYFMGGIYITEILRDYTIVAVSTDKEIDQVYGRVSSPKGDVYIQLRSRKKP